MSEWHVEVVEIGKIKKHENADTLSITNVKDYPVIVRTGEFKEGDKAVYVPIDSIVPTDKPEFAFLEGKPRIKAVRLRGIFSMGLLVKADPSWTIGENVAERMGITKYEPPEPFSIGGDNEKDPGFIPVYTDIEGLRRWPEILQTGEPVVMTEKLHGCNGRFLFRDDRLWVGSRTGIKKEDPNNLWWKIAYKYQLSEKLSTVPNIAIYGEVYGKVQSLNYGIKSGAEFKIFDALDTITRKYLDFDEFVGLSRKLELPIVPILYTGPYSREIADIESNGDSTMPNSDHVREGIVIRLLHERFDERVGRVILKHIGEDYLLGVKKKKK